MLKRSGIAEVKYSAATAVEHVGQDLSNQLDWTKMVEAEGLDSCWTQTQSSKAELVLLFQCEVMNVLS